MGGDEDGTVQEPVNREPGTEQLVRSFLTPSNANAQGSSKYEPVAYERNHGPIQHIDSSTHRLSIKSDPSLSSTSKIITEPIDIELSIEDLTSKFSQTSITSALQCAGNRRHDMRTRVADVNGIDWGNGAVMNAQWKGVLLRDVLFHAGLGASKADNNGAEFEGLHVQFACTTQQTQDDTYYGSSIPLSTAMDPDRCCLLALEMNGSTLPVPHGFPLRVIIPGIIGARSVKWLDSIVIAPRESRNHYQQRDYKILSGDVAKRVQDAGDEEEKGRIMENEVEAMGDNPINCVVAVPGEDRESAKVEKSEDGKAFLRVKGYAIPKGKDGPVVEVEVSVDHGRTWHEARLLDGGDENNTHPSNQERSESGKPERGKFAWVLWECLVPIDESQQEVDIWSKTTDAGGNTMNVDDAEGKEGWNLRGVGFNAVEGKRGIKIVST